MRITLLCRALWLNGPSRVICGPSLRVGPKMNPGRSIYAIILSKAILFPHYYNLLVKIDFINIIFLFIYSNLKYLKYVNPRIMITKKINKLPDNVSINNLLVYFCNLREKTLPIKVPLRVG